MSRYLPSHASYLPTGQRNHVDYQPYRPDSAASQYRPPPIATRPSPATAAGYQGQQHPLQQIYQRLAMLVPQMPRDPDGTLNATYVRGALAVEGIDADGLTLNGFAELLARCDTSPTAFPSFGDFILCLSRGGVGAHGASPSPPSTHDAAAAAAAAYASATGMRHRSEFLTPQDLARIYARGARLHASALQPGLPRNFNTQEMPITEEVLARVPGGERSMPGPLSRPDGYRLDESGSYIGALPGLERHSSWPQEECREELANGQWVVVGDGRGRSSNADDRDASTYGNGVTAVGLGGAAAVTGADGFAGGTKAFITIMPDGAIHGSTTPQSYSRGASMGGEALTYPMTGGRASPSGKTLSERRAYHVARGDAIVPGPGGAGPASAWRKFASR